MQDDVYPWLRHVLEIIGFEDYPACVFLKSHTDPCVEWQLGAEMIRACVVSGLVKLFPSADKHGCPSDEDVLDRLVREDPEQRESPDSEVGNVWRVTYLVGTARCQSLLARHGFLDCRTALIIAEDADQRTASTALGSSGEMPLGANLQARARRLRASAEQSTEMERAVVPQVRQKAFTAELDSLFSSHRVLQYSGEQP